MKATINYTLSSLGQRAALAAGLPATASQFADIEIEAADLDLFDVNVKGELSTDLKNGSERPWAGSTSWASITFDALLTSESAVSFLRRRLADRAAIQLAETEAAAVKKAEEAQKADLQRVADIETLRTAAQSGKLAGVEVNTRSLIFGSYITRREYRVDDADGEVAALVTTILALDAQQKAQANADARGRAALKTLIDSLPIAPPVRPTTLQSDGRYAFTVPAPSHDGAWSKHVTSVDASGSDGMAFDGPWLRCGGETLLAIGEVIVVGAKWWEGSRRNGGYQKERSIYVVTAAGLIGASGNSPVQVAELLARDPADRALQSMEAAMKNSCATIEKLDALGNDQPEQVVALITARRALWCARKAGIETAIAKATAPAPITSVAEAAAAIIAAGYKALALTHHPDKGGDATAMGLLTDARNQLREILALALEVNV